MRNTLIGGFLGCLALIHPAHAQFVGSIDFKPKNCQTSGNGCTLVNDFGFIDPNGNGWQAKAGLKTDGASIPPWAQPFIGGQFDEAFIKAAVIHDHYCVRHVRGFLETHRVFYDALIASGMDAVKANVMYYAVLVGGPKWIKLISGEPCKIGTNCVRSVGGKLSIPDSKVVRGEGGDRYVWRDPIYRRPSVQDDLKEGARIIEQRRISDPSEVLKLARERRSNDPFLHAGAAAIFERASAQR